MCDCEAKILQKFKEMYPESESITGQYEILSGRAYSAIQIKLPNKKKPIERLLLHTYCPVCGKKYEQESTQEVSRQ